VEETGCQAHRRRTIGGDSLAVHRQADEGEEEGRPKSPCGERRTDRHEADGQCAPAPTAAYRCRGKAKGVSDFEAGPHWPDKRRPGSTASARPFGQQRLRESRHQSVPGHTKR